MKNKTSNKKVKSMNSQMLKFSTFIELEETPIEDFMATLRKSGIEATESEAVEMLQFLELLVRITIKEFFLPQ
ncbi:hypothetical protein QX233_03535 [Chryseobacterium gambrini]|uniref:Uncharacterized protein n=1 Tax=Chryseobacterium gambrini TaxID=373672 RepID=A0AAJ1R4K4_9FLAO|nr:MULTISPECIES: hypothetical protein [Chryseobacterium]MDN4011528.1 hypothetical protein [Chryseobacterium gambrini]QWA38294.1 hypothetical protein KKI44_20755 [Chryseobacterium sp. ZHDP1]